jgi:hypothetical protein
MNPNPRRLQLPLWAVLGNGFFIISDIRNVTLAKEIFQAVVEVLEGNVLTNQIENKFTQWAGHRCSFCLYARPM